MNKIRVNFREGNGYFEKEITFPEFKAMLESETSESRVHAVDRMLSLDNLNAKDVHVADIPKNSKIIYAALEVHKDVLTGGNATKLALGHDDQRDAFLTSENLLGGQNIKKEGDTTLSDNTSIKLYSVGDDGKIGDKNISNGCVRVVIIYEDAE